MIKAKGADELRVSIKNAMADPAIDSSDPLEELTRISEEVGGYFNPKTLVLSPLEQAALWQLLDRDRTCRPVHGGLGTLLSLSHEHAQALLGLLRRVFE